MIKTPALGRVAASSVDPGDPLPLALDASVDPTSDDVDELELRGSIAKSSEPEADELASVEALVDDDFASEELELPLDPLLLDEELESGAEEAVEDPADPFEPAGAVVAGAGVVLELSLDCDGDGVVDGELVGEEEVDVGVGAVVRTSHIVARNSTVVICSPSTVTRHSGSEEACWKLSITLGQLRPAQTTDCCAEVGYAVNG